MVACTESTKIKSAKPSNWMKNLRLNTLAHFKVVKWNNAAWIAYPESPYRCKPCISIVSKNKIGRGFLNTSSVPERETVLTFLIISGNFVEGVVRKIM